MKKIFLLILSFFIVLLFPTKTFAKDLTTEIIKSQEENFGISEFVDEANKYKGELFEDSNISDMINSSISGKIDNNTFLKKILNIFFKEISSSFKTLVTILVIVLIHSIIKTVSDNFQTSDISNLIFYVQYVLIVTIIMNNFSNILSNITNTVNNLIGFMNTLVPLLITLMAYTGSIVTSGLLEPIIIFVIEFIGNIIVTMIIPLISIITALIIVSKISDKIQIGKLANFMKSSIVWFLGVILTIFVGIVSLEGTLTSSVDGITAKTAKTAISSIIPVVGKILGDSVDSVLGCGLVLKKALGVVGVVIIISICITPIIKLATLSIIYSISSAIIEPLADTKIVKLLEEFSRYIQIAFSHFMFSINTPNNRNNISCKTFK